VSGVRSDLSRLLLCLVVLGALAVARGRIETEGNLGRTDLFLSLGGGHSLPEAVEERALAGRSEAWYTPWLKVPA